MRWRFLEINSRLTLARFIAIQREGEKPAFDPGWRRWEALAAADGLFGKPINQIGNRHGDWHEGEPPAKEEPHEAPE